MLGFIHLCPGEIFNHTHSLLEEIIVQDAYGIYTHSTAFFFLISVTRTKIDAEGNQIAPLKDPSLSDEIEITHSESPSPHCPCITAFTV